MTQDTDTKEIEVTVENVTEKFGGSLYANGQWWAYSKPDYRGAWYEPRKGDRVRLILSPWHKDDGTTKWYVKSIESLATFEDPAGNQVGEPPNWTFKDKDQLIWLEVLIKAAVELRITAVDSETFNTAVADVTQAVGQWRLLGNE